MVSFTATADPAKVAAALKALSRDMDDPYLLPDGLLARMLTQSNGTTSAILAEDADSILGVALFSVFVSTTRGQVGAFVTDLWVDRNQRGSGLGRALLARVRDEVAAQWGATFLRLNYYADNADAARFYSRLGFCPKPQETWVTLEGNALRDLT